MEQVERAAGRRPAQLDGPELPAAVDHVWGWYLELHAARGGSGFGPSPIGFTEMAAWAALTGNHPSPWEVETLRALDQAHLDHQAENKPPTKQQGGA
ncbi:phage tail assembly chaperone [Pseudomonas juntendi]|uniref:phage tail assembly chaperone n=1 Tax=Pseudomonas juntendi TaxID=2666183 RepID=UPI003F49423E